MVVLMFVLNNVCWSKKTKQIFIITINIHFILFSKIIQNFKIHIYIHTHTQIHTHACICILCVYTVYTSVCVHIYITI